MNDTISALTLIATATYNEANNIKELLARIRNVCGSTVDILVVDDNSPDGTAEIVAKQQLNDPNLFILKRKYKLGLGSAQKAIIVYSIINNYEKVIVLDADLSHRPEDIPALVAMSRNNGFVIGSRYIKGGSSNYSGIRNIVSRIGNSVARVALGVKLHELTTSFRVYDVDSLRKIPINRIKSNGYAFFVEIISLLQEQNVQLAETPIFFCNRKHDVSKIPSIQILYSSLSLIKLVAKRLMVGRTPLGPEWWNASSCVFCGHNVLILHHDRINTLYDCLVCGQTKIRLDTVNS